LLLNESICFFSQQIAGSKGKAYFRADAFTLSGVMHPTMGLIATFRPEGESWSQRRIAGAKSPSYQQTSPKSLKPVSAKSESQTTLVVRRNSVQPPVRHHVKSRNL